MATCQKCQQDFANRPIIDGKQRDITYRKYCLECSPFRSHNTRRLEDEPILYKCKYCGEDCTIRRKQTHKNMTCRRCYIKIKRDEKKAQLLEAAGGQCAICGYNRCSRALSFHHRDPEHKSFAIGLMMSLSIEKLLAESEKCILLCHNCHCEVHDNITPLPEAESIGPEPNRREST
jgi:hypothetical protein